MHSTVCIVLCSSGSSRKFLGGGWPLEDVDCRAPENTTAQQLKDNLHCGTCIGSKTGGLGENWGGGGGARPKNCSWSDNNATQQGDRWRTEGTVDRRWDLSISMVSYCPIVPNLLALCKTMRSKIVLGTWRLGCSKSNPFISDAHIVSPY